MSSQKEKKFVAKTFSNKNDVVATFATTKGHCKF